MSRVVDFGAATVATPGVCGSGELSGAVSEHCATNREEGDSDARLEFGILWDAMTKDVPLLLPMFRKLVAALPPAPDKPANIGDFM